MDSTLSQESQESNRAVWELPDDETEWEDLWQNWEKRKEEDDLIYHIERGRLGLNVGMDNGLPALSQHTYGTHRGRYYLIGAESGTGKTSVSDFMFLYKMWLYCRAKGIRLYIKYFSFELSKSEKKAKWISMFLFHLYRLSVPSDYIMGRIPGVLVSDEHMKMVLKAYSAVEDMMSCVEIYDSPIHPTGLLTRLIEDHYANIGTITRDAPKEGKKGFIRGYKLKDPMAVTVVVVDHMALAHSEKDCTTTKQIIDKLSMYFVHLRNIFGTTVCAVQQFNTDMTASQRERKKDQAVLVPQRVDFGDSKYTYRDFTNTYCVCHRN